MTDEELEAAMLTVGAAVASSQEDATGVMVADVLVLVSYSDDDGGMALCWNRLDSTTSWVALGMAHAFIVSQVAEATAIKTTRALGDDD